MLKKVVIGAMGLALLAGAACSSKSDAAAKIETGPVTLRLGYFPNLTHAPAIYGVDKGVFAEALGANVTLKTSIFNAGPAAVEAIFANSIDASFVGPNPAINAFQKSNGQAVRIIAGATSGGAALIVQPEITSAADLKGKTIATPQLGNTQDVALRSWLKSQGFTTDTQGGGDVHVLPQDNSQTIDTFKQHKIDGAWVPEPYASRLVVEAKGKMLLDEKTLWPSGEYATTVLVVRTQFLKDHPTVVQSLLKGEVEAIDALNADPIAGATAVNDGIASLTGKSLKPDTLTAAWARLKFSTDPLIAEIQKVADNALALGFLANATLTGIADIKPLNAVLNAAGKPEVRI